MYFVGNIPMTS